MPTSRKRKAKQAPSGAWGLVVGGLFVAFVALAATLIYLKVARSKSGAYQGELIAAWRDADQAFLQARFATAKTAYEELIRLLEANSSDARLKADLDLAQGSAAVVAAGEPVEQALDKGTLPALHDLDAKLRQLATLPPATTSVAPHVAGAKAGLELPALDRVQSITGWLILKIQLSHDVAESGGPTAAQAAEIAAALIDFVGSHGGPVDSLRQRQSKIEQNQALASARQQFEGAVAAGLQAADETAFLQVKSTWQALRKQFPQEASFDAGWQAFCQNLRGELVRKVVAVGPDPAGGEITLLDHGPERLSTASACALLGAALAAPVNGPLELVFGLTADRCYALDATTGRPRWVVRTGFDTSGLPELVTSDAGPLAIVAWRQEGRQILSALSAESGANVWTAQLPADVQLAGPPLAHRGQLHLLIESGELWHLSLRTGKLLGKLRFPEAAAGSLVLREDGRGAILFGRQMACYTLELDDPVRVRDVIELTPDGDTLDTFGFWIPPLVVFLQNRFTGQSVLRVLHQQEDGYRQVQRLELPGRLWQPPVVHGSQFLLATDDGHEAVFGVNLNDPAAPVYDLVRADAPPSAAPQRPVFTASSTGPFLLQRGHVLERLAIDPLEAKGRQRNTIWRHELEPGTVPTQPLQRSEELLFAAGQLPGREGVRLTGVRAADGQPAWSCDLAAAAQEVLVDQPGRTVPPRAIIRTSLGGLFALVVSAPNEWTTKSLAAPGVNQSLEWARQSRLLAWVTIGAEPQLCVAQLGGSVQLTLPLDEPAASPLAAWEGPLTIRSTDGSTANSAAGVWIAFIDARSRLGLVQASGGQTVPQFLQLPEGAPRSGWQRPIWIGGEHVVLTHPAGWVLTASVYASGGVPYLALSENGRKMPYQLVGLPLMTSGAVWLAGSDKSLHALSVPSLEPLGREPLPAPATTGPIGQYETWVGLRDGSLAAYRNQSGTPKLERTLTVSNRPIVLVWSAPHPARALAVDRAGQVFHLGATATRLGAISTAAMPPVFWQDTLFFATSVGSVETFSIPSQLSARAP